MQPDTLCSKVLQWQVLLLWDIINCTKRQTAQDGMFVQQPTQTINQYLLFSGTLKDNSLVKTKE